MSEDLQALRAQIDAIDRDMVRLFETRMGVSGQVAAYKLERGLPVLDAAREEQVLDARAALAQADNGEDVRALYTCISQGYRNVFFYNDRLAYELLGKLDSIAINIRRIYPDLHLVGFDGLCECVAGLKQISTIKIDFPEFAEKTYEVIKKRLEQPLAPMQQIVLKVTLHQRRKD